MTEIPVPPGSQNSGPLQRTLPPLGVFVLAIFLGGVAALLAPLGHVHFGEHGAEVHQHLFSGPHSHPQGPSGPPVPAGPDRADATLVLALALTLETFVPACLPAPATFLASTPARPRAAVGRLLPATPWAPRGPPPFQS